MPYTIYNLLGEEYESEEDFEEALYKSFQWDDLVEYCLDTSITLGTILESLKKNDPELFNQIYEEALELFKDDFTSFDEYPDEYDYEEEEN